MAQRHHGRLASRLVSPWGCGTRAEAAGLVCAWWQRLLMLRAAAALQRARSAVLRRAAAWRPLQGCHWCPRRCLDNGLCLHVPDLH